MTSAPTGSAPASLARQLALQISLLVVVMVAALAAIAFWSVQREIAELHLADEVARLKLVGFDLEVSREALEFLIREGFHPQLGARPLRQTIERQLQDAVVRGLFATGTRAGRIVHDPTLNSLHLGD